jgi:hypothetical protein
VTGTATPTSSATLTPTDTATEVSAPVIEGPYPNPSNGSPVSFTVQVPSQSEVMLDVFTLAFRKISDQSTEGNGTLTMQWDLKDLSGTQVADGLYYVRIRVKGTRNAVKILKVLVLR